MTQKDLLQIVLRRAKAASEELRRLRERRVALGLEKSTADLVSEDYSRRLAEKALYRELLSDERQDGLRFRWYFQHIEKLDIDQLRRWIDSKIQKEPSRCLRPSETGTSESAGTAHGAG